MRHNLNIRPGHEQDLANRSSRKLPTLLVVAIRMLTVWLFYAGVPSRNTNIFFRQDKERAMKLSTALIVGLFISAFCVGYGN
jgi:hypothetical protein